MYFNIVILFVIQMLHSKEQLDKVKMEYVKSTVFKFHPCTQADKVSDVWKDCIAMIDESNRRLNKHKKTA